MKYWDLINVGSKTSLPTPEPEVEEKTPVEIPQELSDNVKKIMEFMEELKSKDCTPPPGFEDTALNGEEIAEVVSMLLEFQDKYFKDTPLTDSLSKSFMWNIPKHIYDTAIKMRNYGEPDCLNPIYWFYIMCLGDPAYMMAKFLVLATNAIKDEDYDRIDELASMYDEDNGIGYPVIDDEVDIEEYTGDTPNVNDDLTIDISSFDEEIDVGELNTNNEVSNEEEMESE